jgi:hypothetical protein
VVLVVLEHLMAMAQMVQIQHLAWLLLLLSVAVVVAHSIPLA